MASIRKEIYIDAPVTLVWGALRDVGALHTKLVPGFVTDTRMDGTARIVTFGNGMVAREEIVSVDEKRHRVAWAILDAPFQHYSAAAWVEAKGEGLEFRMDRGPAAERIERPGRGDDERRHPGDPRHHGKHRGELTLSPRPALPPAAAGWPP